MPVPDYQSLMLPVLNALADGSPTPIAEVRARVAVSQGLTPGDLAEVMPNSGQRVFVNRVGWTIWYLKRAGLAEWVRRAVYRLTSEGRTLLAKRPSCVDLHYLQKHTDYVTRDRAAKRLPVDPQPVVVDTPEEALENAAQELRTILEAEVLDRVRNAAPAFLERAVVDLLIAMGYGGGDADRGRVTGRSGDGGIDGTIREDALGLDEVYVQAKRYGDGNSVGEGDLRNFAGAIDAAGTTKGVFVNTASFTRAAQDYVKRSPKRIILIDGAELARLLVKHGIGVRTHDRYEVKRIDEDYFDQ